MVAVHLALVLLGAALGVWGAFLVPLRLPGGVEGLADLVAVLGNAGVGFAAARATRSVPAALMPGIGWLVAMMLTIGYLRPSDEVVIPGSLASDPGIGTVGTLFLFAGPLGTVVAVVLAQRFTRRAERPTSHE
jgi:hypothetical protein